ncbi:BTB/POZ domain-containing protein 9 [Galendromus occidentalis]|uniref:BTB/POZ domain-containing protein 9 n=1 Tax=Galendromus occidentalis TaxID=34638 RepID=A0AAJ6QQP4_9ACAR|nr:BTB/POZ domain-containing protein 9 [Galendromus occidentalis]
MGSLTARLAIFLAFSPHRGFGVPCEPNVSPRRSAFQDVCQALPAYDAAFNDINMTQKVEILQFLEDKVAAALDCEELETLSPGALAELLCKPWRVEEIRVFRAIWRWHQRDFGRWEGKSKDLLNKIHLAAIPAALLQHEVLPSKLFDCALIVDALAVKIRFADSIDLFQRFIGQESLNVNVINASQGASVISGTDGEVLLSKHLFQKPRCAHHALSDTSGITIKLGTSQVINSVLVHLFDDDGREYSYYVEVSIDGISWSRIIDHTGDLVKGKVLDKIPPTEVGFVRVVGTRNTNERSKNSFHLCELQAALSE